MTKDEALRLALEVLEELNETNSYWWQEVDEVTTKKIDPAITAIKATLEAKDEPVAWMHIQGNHEEPSFRQLDDWEIQNGWKQYPLYTTPPQRKPLSDEEITEIFSTTKGLDFYLNFARAIEAAHGITGDNNG